MTNTPYDDVFRTLLNDCPGLILPVVNEVFHENYTGNEKIVFSQNECWKSVSRIQLSCSCATQKLHRIQ